MKHLLFIILLIILNTTSSLAADCINPAGVAGKIIFNVDHKVLQFCDGADWMALGGGRSAQTAGNNGEIQFNNNGNLGASSNLFWNPSNSRLGIGTNTPQGKLDVVGMIINRSNTLVHGVNAAAPAGTQVWQSVINTANGHYSLGYRTDDIPTSGGLDFVPFRIQALAPNHSLSINTSGNVAIGNSTATEKLHVFGNIKLAPGNALYTDIIHASITLAATTPTVTSGITCTHNGTYPNINYTDCTCPAGYMIIAGGASTNLSENAYLRETRPSGISSWRVSCKLATDNTSKHCAAASITCARIQPN